MRRLALPSAGSGGLAVSAAVLPGVRGGGASVEAAALGRSPSAAVGSDTSTPLPFVGWIPSLCDMATSSAMAAGTAIRLFSTSVPLRKPTGSSSSSSAGGGNGSSGSGSRGTKKTARSAAEEPQTSLATEAATAAAISLARSQLRRWRAKRPNAGQGASSTKSTTTTAATAVAAAATSSASISPSGRRRGTRRLASRAAARGSAPTSNTKRGYSSKADHSTTEAREASREKTVQEAVSVAEDKSMSARTTVPAALRRRPHGDYAVSPLYFTERCASHGQPPTEEEIIAERASVTKLFVISDSVASIFSSLPHDAGSIHNYLNEVDRAVLPPSVTDAEGSSADGFWDSSEHAHRISAEHNTTYAINDVAQRVLTESAADHTLCIHVREMEQLVPPAHLRQPPASARALATTVKPQQQQQPSRHCRGGRRANRKNTPPPAIAISSSSISGSSPAAPAETALEVLHRVKALHEWQAQAMQRSRASQARWVLPDSAHAITRVRMHEPHKADLTVVQGSGGPKSVENVLEAIRHKLGDGWDADADAALMASEHGPVDEPSELDQLNAMGAIAARSVGQRVTSNLMRRPPPRNDRTTTSSSNSSSPHHITTLQALLSAPFKLKPLLTVIATCVPRRESYLGARYDESHFIATVDDSGNFKNRNVTRASRAGPGAVAGASTPGDTSRIGDVASTVVSESQQHPELQQPQAHLTDDEVYAILKDRGVPAMPRYSTRITILIEHDALEPTDLLSLAEISTTRKDQNTASDARGRKAKKVSSQGAAPAPKSVKPKRRKTQVYCLVVDGGEL